MRLLLPLLAVAFLLVACTEAEKEATPTAPPTVSAPWRGEGTKLELTTWKLTCPLCEKRLEDEIRKIDGVTGVEADKGTGLVRVDLADAGRREAVVAKVREVVHAQGKKILGEDPVGKP